MPRHGTILLGFFLSSVLVFAKEPDRPPEDDLAAAARTASDVIRTHQKPEGYWLTWYTSAARFQDPKPEMNTYLTSVMTDLMSPIAEATGLTEVVLRARKHLTEQIESTGLVRYHGRPVSASISAGLGCVITPDSDDTVLVWKIAPASDPGLLQRAIEVLKRYRTPEGLYQIWLAPRSEFSCIDPGSDPNPPDAGVQLHAYLLLARADPPAARALCGAMKKTIGEERLWVYCKVAPLESLLRRAEVRRAGCVLKIPETRLVTTVAGQDVWLDAARVLERLTNPGGPRPKVSDVAALLRTLARDRFSAVRKSPPLLYHNDFTAGVSRFYWSEDFGYALWLRIYAESARNGSGRTAFFHGRPENVVAHS
ncbi:MAG TPA: hypothetical protein VJA66_04930 [Thermoanaerobaculia bacterium]